MNIESISENQRFAYKMNNRIVGILRGNVVYKECFGSKHMLRKPVGWAIQSDLLYDAYEKGAIWISIKDLEIETCFWAKINDFLTSGIFFNRGYGNQHALPMDKFQKLPEGQFPSEQLELEIGFEEEPDETNNK